MTPRLPGLFIAALLSALLLLLGGCRGDRAGERAAPPDGVTVAGSVKVPEGADAFGVQVFAEGTGFSAFTDSSGGFTIRNVPVGAYVLRAMHADYDSVQVASITVAEEDLLKPQPAFTLKPVELKPREAAGATAAALIPETPENAFGSLRGRVLLTGSPDASGVVVSVSGTEVRTVTDAAGGFFLARLEPGTAQLLFERTGYRPANLVQEVVAGKELSPAPVTLSPELAGGATRTILGRVQLQLADGTLGADYASVRIAVEGTSYATTPDSNGFFQLSGLPAGSYRVAASAPGYLLESPAFANVNDLPSVEVALALLEEVGDVGLETATIEGRVLIEGEGRALSGVSVLLSGTSIVAFTDPRGEYRLERVPPGEYDLVATLNGFLPDRIEGIGIEGSGVYTADDLYLEEDVERPVVVFTSPDDGARDVAIEQPTAVTIQFSQPMDAGSVRAALSITPEVSFRFQAGGGASTREGLSVVQLLLDGSGGKPLGFRKRYTVSIAEGARDLKGVEMAEPYEFSFTTGGARVIDSFPVDGAEDVLPFFDRPVQVVFNAPVDRTSLDIGDFSFRPEPVALPNLRFRNDRNTGWTTVYLDGQWDYDTEYRVTLRRGRTITRDRIENLPYTFRFTTPEAMDADTYFGLSEDEQNRREQERARRR
ncbi:MAG: carboxypeptidase regulatory-like domain-containing protein [Candidatus Sumerlaeia bacterium]|nr:carboxypeptidase regulatory-like domain-containing protein [Candidatus Sumerlaeia bacterium]